MSRIFTLCAAALSLAACAPKDDLNGDGIVDGVRHPNSVSQIAPSTPVGTISGVVINTQNTGIEGAQVTMIVGEGSDASRTYKTTTNAEGAYVFKDVPGGSGVQLLISKTGYSNARLSSNVPGAVGNFPINDGNGSAGVLTLTQLNGTQKFRVYTSQGRPAKGAKAFLEVKQTAFQTFNGVYGDPCGNYSGAAEVDENGLLTFTGSPDLTELSRISGSIVFALTIGALDEDSPPDGRADALGTISNFTASSLFTNPDRTIILGDAHTLAPLQIVATNLDSFTGAFAPVPQRGEGEQRDLDRLQPAHHPGRHHPRGARGRGRLPDRRRHHGHSARAERARHHPHGRVDAGQALQHHRARDRPRQRRHL